MEIDVSEMYQDYIDRAEGLFSTVSRGDQQFIGVRESILAMAEMDIDDVSDDPVPTCLMFYGILDPQNGFSVKPEFSHFLSRLQELSDDISAYVFSLAQKFEKMRISGDEDVYFDTESSVADEDEAVNDDLSDAGDDFMVSVGFDSIKGV